MTALMQPLQGISGFSVPGRVLIGPGPSDMPPCHHAAPVDSLFALREALVMLKEEGLEDAWAPQRLHREALKSGLEALGLKFLVRKEARLLQLNAVLVSTGIDEALVRTRLLDEVNLEIGAGLGPLAGKIWRFDLTGYSSRIENVILCLGALTQVLSEMGRFGGRHEVEAAARSVYAAQQNGKGPT